MDPTAGAIVFSSATVVDGTGSPRYTADVLVQGDRIAWIGEPGALEPRTNGQGGAAPHTRRIDARGRVLAPGFIDMHAHSDLAVLRDPAHLAKLSQGITTEVIGQDGLAYAPVDDAALAQVRRQIAGWNGNPDDLDFGWRSVADYLDRLDAGTPTNVAFLVPQGNLRMLTVGLHDHAASAGDLDRMSGILHDGLDAGAVGMSSGLSYTPGMYAGTAELEALCAVVAEHGGYYAPHTRSYGAGALDAYAEVIGIARRTGCALHLTHATLNFGSNRDSAPAFLAMVDAALDDGVDVTLDSYPYLAGATTLAALLPSWFAVGGTEALIDRLATLDSPAMAGERDRLDRALDVTGSDGFHGEVADWSAIEISGVVNPELAGYVGRTIAEIADTERRGARQVVTDVLLRDELATSILMHVGHEHNVQAVMRHRVHSGGSDGILVGTRPHPRAWGSFPRYLGHYIRDLGVLTLEEGIRHLAGTPARRLRLPDRGLVREGYVADLVLFDPATVRDTATFERPRRQAEGISHVLVGGELAIDDGGRTDAVSGRVLRSTPSTEKATP
ncbi:N-acyl-D-amino-acid deacylase family protein [Glaciibacter sp. 2TAF33]|uniref:N-acyl-D-amino-acid deacylase family protein n=1 Tax=Glaciibacter sp. 2TAF33 TaxID=3233015 RepID=UPI003F8E8612